MEESLRSDDRSEASLAVQLCMLLLADTSEVIIGGGADGGA